MVLLLVRHLHLRLVRNRCRFPAAESRSFWKIVWYHSSVSKRRYNPESSDFETIDLKRCFINVFARATLQGRQETPTPQSGHVSIKIYFFRFKFLIFLFCTGNKIGDYASIEIRDLPTCLCKSDWPPYLWSH